MTWQFYRDTTLSVTTDELRALGIRATNGPFTAFLPANKQVRLTLQTKQPSNVSIVVGIPGAGPGGYISKVLRPYGENPAELPSVVINTPAQDFCLLYEFHEGDKIWAQRDSTGVRTATEQVASAEMLSKNMGLRIQWPAYSCNVPDSVGTRAIAGTPVTELGGDRIISDGSRWGQQIINYGFDYDRVGDIGFSRDQVSSALRQSFDTWKGAPISPQFSERNHKPEVVRIGSRDATVTAKLQIRCSWPPESHSCTLSHQGTASFDGKLAHAVPLSGVLTGSQSEAGGICFNKGIPWGLNGEPDRFDFISVAIHEIGHALGLGHSQNPSSVMFPNIGVGEKMRTLADEDKVLIRHLYP